MLLPLNSFLNQFPVFFKAAKQAHRGTEEQTGGSVAACESEAKRFDRAAQAENLIQTVEGAAFAHNHSNAPIFLFYLIND